MKLTSAVPARAALLACVLACAGCGSSDAQAPAVCGTHSNPAILRVTELAPAIGATVVNRDIVHSFTVINAPAVFTAFDFKYGTSHTAQYPSPLEPRFQAEIVDTNVSYRLTISAWSRSPSHVELSADGTFDTKSGCTWAFPSPLFSYDVVSAPALDGGIALDGGLALDARVVVDGHPDHPVDALARDGVALDSSTSEAGMSAADADDDTAGPGPDIAASNLDADVVDLAEAIDTE